MIKAFRLAYIDLHSPSIEAAGEYYRDVLGMGESETVGGSAYLSLGLDHHNIGLRQADRPSLGAVGLQIAGAASLAEVARHLSAAGLSPELRTDARPGVAELLELRDIGGHVFHLFTDMAVVGRRFSGRGVAPTKLGHLALLSADAPRLVAFLRELLGFHVTDRLEDLATFLTCNADHHVLNVLAAPVSTMHHLAFQLDGREHHFRAADALAAHDIATLWGPARHTAGHNVAAYHHGADGALVEFYTDMDVFVPELGYCEPRPWHPDLPQRPKRWPLSSFTRWETRFEFDLASSAFGMAGPPS